MTQGLSRTGPAALFFAVLLGACCSSPKTLDDGEFCGNGFKVLLGGDFGFGDTYKEGKEALEKYGYDRPLEKLAPFLNAADYSIINLETPVTDVDLEKYRGKKKYVHRGKVGVYPKYLKKYGIDAVSLANNHAMDCGAEGILQTVKILDASGVSRFGAGADGSEAGRPFTKGIKIGSEQFELAVFTGYEHSKKKDDEEYSSRFASPEAPGVNPLSAEKLYESIARYKKDNPASFVVVFPHWGANYTWKSPEQTKTAERLIDSGADIVIGHGAHLVQEIEKYKGKWVFYSLGNFMFNTRGRYQKKQTWTYSAISILRFSFDREKLNCRFRFYPVVSDNLATDYQTRPVDEREFNEAIKLLKGKSPGVFSSDLAAGKDRLGFYLEGIVLE